MFRFEYFGAGNPALRVRTRSRFLPSPRRNAHAGLTGPQPRSSAQPVLVIYDLTHLVCHKLPCALLAAVTSLVSRSILVDSLSPYSQSRPSPFPSILLRLIHDLIHYITTQSDQHSYKTRFIQNFFHQTHHQIPNHE
jgi:hypothetical protein